MFLGRIYFCIVLLCISTFFNIPLHASEHKELFRAPAHAFAAFISDRKETLGEQAVKNVIEQLEEKENAAVVAINHVTGHSNNPLQFHAQLKKRLMEIPFDLNRPQGSLDSAALAEKLIYAKEMPQLNNMAKKLCAEFRIDPSVITVFIDKSGYLTSNACTFGNTIVVGREFLAATPAEQQAMLSHEFGHIVNGDSSVATVYGQILNQHGAPKSLLNPLQQAYEYRADAMAVFHSSHSALGLMHTLDKMDNKVFQHFFTKRITHPSDLARIDYIRTNSRKFFPCTPAAEFKFSARALLKSEHNFKKLGLIAGSAAGLTYAYTTKKDNA